MDERGRGAVVVETPEKRHPREAWGKGGTAPVVLYQNIEFEDGATRRKARVLPFYSDATDEEIAAATLGSADENAYWSHFGSDFDAATEAGKKYEADGIPTKTSRHGGAQWASVTAAGIASEESKARTVESTEPCEAGLPVPAPPVQWWVSLPKTPLRRCASDSNRILASPFL